MFHVINGVTVFVANLIRQPSSYLPILDGGIKELAPYARALDTAIRNGLVSKPGLYAIELSSNKIQYKVYSVD
jgi:hypothetical protein